MSNKEVMYFYSVDRKKKVKGDKYESIGFASGVFTIASGIETIEQYITATKAIEEDIWNQRF